MSIIAHSDISTLEHKRDTSDRRIGFDGYGQRKHPTQWMVRLPGNRTWRRVYVCCISNAGTAYVTYGKNWHVINGTP